MFTLWPKISLSETEFLVKHNFTEKHLTGIRVNLLKISDKCRGCEIENSERKLSVHLVEENEEDPTRSKFTLLCMDCHFVAHIDKAIEKNYVVLVNSSFSQGELVSICRNKRLKKEISAGNIMLLEKKPEVYLEELTSGFLGKNRIKVVFSPKNYKWD